MSRSTPRRPSRPASSRTTTPRPRRIAGQGGTGRTERELVSAPGGSPPEEPPPPPAPPAGGSVAERGPRRIGDLLASGGTTRVLTAVVGVLAVLLLLQITWFVVHAVRDDAEAQAASDRPIVMSEIAVQEGVDAAAKAAKEFVDVDYRHYDKEVEEAAALMTPSFAEEYRQAAEDVRRDIIRDKTVVQTEIAAQGAAGATDTEVRALVFLNQFVIKGEKENSSTTGTEYRALVTVVHTDEGWLLDDVETK